MVEVIFEDAEVKLGASGPLIIAVYKRAPTLGVMERLDAAETKLLEKHPRLSVLTIISAVGDALKVDEKVRARGVELSHKYDKVVRGSAIVIAVKGLAAVVVRSFLSAFFLLSKSAMPSKTFGDVGEAVRWLQSLPEQDIALKTELKLAQDVQQFAGVK